MVLGIAHAVPLICKALQGTEFARFECNGSQELCMQLTVWACFLPGSPFSFFVRLGYVILSLRL